MPKRTDLKKILLIHGVLDKFHVQMIGATPEAIEKAEDREKFNPLEERFLSGAPRRIARSVKNWPPS